MDKKEFSLIRQHLGETQQQLAQLLGTSSKAIQRFEQVLFLVVLSCSRSRKAPPYRTERQAEASWIDSRPTDALRQSRRSIRPHSTLLLPLLEGVVTITGGFNGLQ